MPIFDSTKNPYVDNVLTRYSDEARRIELIADYVVAPEDFRKMQVAEKMEYTLELLKLLDGVPLKAVQYTPESSSGLKILGRAVYDQSSGKIIYSSKAKASGLKKQPYIEMFALGISEGGDATYYTVKSDIDDSSEHAWGTLFELVEAYLIDIQESKYSSSSELGEIAIDQLRE